MQAGDVRLGQVFANHQQNVIPLFQRPYVWTQERNWDPLWQDIRLAAEEVEREDSSLITAGSERTYFLGAVVLQQRKVNPKRLSSWYVIDGQQRLTTLQVLLAACRQTATDLGESSLAAKFTSLIENQQDIVHSDHPEDKYKVWPLPQDREIFLWAVDRLESAKPSPDPEHKLTQARNWFGQTVAEWVAEVDDPGLRLGYLYETVYERMQLVKIALEQNDDPQVIFEVLNHRGVPLDAADLIKNLLFQVLAERGQDKLADSLLMESWLPLDQSYWRNEVTIGRFYRKRIDLLLSYWLTIETAEEVSMEHLFSDFKTWLRASERDIPAIIGSIRHFADTMQAMRNLPATEPLAQLIDRMDATQTNTPWPLILYLSANPTIPESARNKAASAIDSFLMRRGVCRMTTKDYNRLFVQVLAIAKRVEPSDVGDAVEQALLDQTSESRFWPTDDMFLRALEDPGLYRNLVRRQLAALLLGIENHLRSEKTEEGKVLKSGDGKLNIEHLLPQTWQKTWPLAINQDDAAYPEYLERRARSVHQLGNLTLTTVVLNPSLSNKPWKDKRPEIQKHSLLRLTTGSVLTAPRPESDLSDQEWSGDWNEERIRVRTEHLAQEAIRVWPRPQSEGVIPSFASGRQRYESNKLTDRRKDEIAQILLNLIRSTPHVIEDEHAGSNYIRFLPPLFDQPWLTGSRWTQSGRMLLFEFRNLRDRLDLVLWVGPGDKQKRKYLIDVVEANPTDLLRLPASGPGTGRWSELYRRDLGQANQFNELSHETLFEALREKWTAFIHGDMPAIVEALRGPITDPGISRSAISPGRESPGSSRLTSTRKDEIAQILIDLMRSTPDVIEDEHDKPTYFRFLPPLFDQPWLKGAHWTESGRILLFEFRNLRDRLDLVLWVGPGDAEKRKTLFDIVDADQSGLIGLLDGRPRTRWGGIYRKDFGRADLLNRLSAEALLETLREQWTAFIQDDMPDIVEALRKPIAKESQGFTDAPGDIVPSSTADNP